VPMVNPKHSHQVTRRNSNQILILRTVLVFICHLVIYSSTYSGTFRVDDEHILAARAQSYYLWGHFDYPQIYGNDRVRHLSLVQEDSASPVVAIEPGQAILGSLFFRFASNFGLDGVQSFFLLNLYATALTGSLVFLIIGNLGYPPNTAILTSLLFGIGTMAWPYSKTAFRDPLAMMFITLAFWGWVILLTKERRRFIGTGFFLLGIICGTLVKSNVLITIPSFILSGMVINYQERDKPKRNHRWLFYLPILVGILFILAGVFIPIIGPISRLSISNYISLIQRYLHEANWQTVLAILGPFFSPAKSIFLFNPILILVPFATIRFWNRLRDIALPSLLTMFLLVVAQALHLGEQWAGSLYWGLRFLLPVLPLLVVLLAPLVEWLFQQMWGWKHTISSLIMGTTLLVQLAGAVVAWHIPYMVWQSRDLDPYVTEAVWSWKFLVIPIHFNHLVDPDSWDIAWIRTLAYEPQAIVVPIILGIALGLGLIGTRWIRSWSTRRDFFLGFLATIVIILSVFPYFPSLWIYKADPLIGGQQPELQSLVSWAENIVENGDLVLVDSYGTKLWRTMMGEWDQSIPWYSLPFEIPGMTGVGWTLGGRPSDAVLDLIVEVGSKYKRLVYLTTDETPDYLLMREKIWFDKSFQSTLSISYHGMVSSEGYLFLP
jgi:hypothetical protein